MKIPKRFKIHKAAAREKTRYAINGVQVRPITRVGVSALRLSATDGRMMAQISVPLGPNDDLELDAIDKNAETRVVQREVIEDACKGTAKVPALVHLNGEARSANGASLPYLDAKFPDCDGVKPKGKPVFKATFDAQRLYDLALALGAKGGPKDEAVVELAFFDEDALLPIRVRPIGMDDDAVKVLDEHDPEGYLMPVMSHEQAKKARGRWADHRR